MRWSAPCARSCGWPRASARPRSGGTVRAMRTVPAGRRRRAPLPGRPGGGALDADAVLGQVVAGLGAGFDPEWGGYGPAPKFPRPTLVELCLRRAARGGADAAARTSDGAADARRHGRRRHLRPSRGRLLPLLDGRPMARAALREDAHRPGAPRPGLPPCVAGHRACGVPRRRHRDPGLRPAGSVDPRGCPLLVLRRRRRRGRRSARDLHPRRISRRSFPRRSSGRRPSGTGSPSTATGRGGPSRCARSAHRSSDRPRSRRPAPCWPQRGRNGSNPPGTRRS